MKLKEFIQKYKIILFLSFLVVVMILLKLKYGVNTESNQNIISNPTATPTMTFTEYYPEEMMETKGD